MDDDTRTFTKSLPFKSNQELYSLIFIKTNEAQDAIGAALGTADKHETAATHRQNAFDALQVAILAQLVLDVRANRNEEVIKTGLGPVRVTREEEAPHTPRNDR